MIDWKPEPFSPLGWARCTKCPVGYAMVVEAWADRARCGSCLAAEHPPAPPSSDPPGAVVGWRIGGRTPPISSVARMERHPRPEWTSRMEPPEGWEHPGAVRSLVAYAQGLGWRTRVQYSRGNGMHARTSAPTGLSHMVAVRIGHHEATDRAAYSLYVSPVDRNAWTWKSHWTWGPGVPPMQVGTLTEMKEWLVSSVVSYAG